MPTSRHRRLTPEQVMKLYDDITGLGSIAGYTPVNSQLSLENLKKLAARVTETQQAARLAERAADLARDAQIAAEWELKNTLVSVRAQVEAQFGRDSAEVEAVGRKRLSDRKRPVRKKKDDKNGGKNSSGDKPSNGDKPTNGDGGSSAAS